MFDTITVNFCDFKKSEFVAKTQFLWHMHRRILKAFAFLTRKSKFAFNGHYVKKKPKPIHNSRNKSPDL